MLPKACLLPLLLPAVASAASATEAGSCTASSLTVGGENYTCVTGLLDGEVSLHWTITNLSDGSVNVALEKTGTGGWLSIGFPQAGSQMVGAHAIVAKGSDTLFLHLTSMSPPFPVIDANKMRCEFAGASSVVQDGQTIITISGAKVKLSEVHLIVALHDSCTWPCEHSKESHHELNLLDGGMEIESDDDSTKDQKGSSLVLGTTHYQYAKTVLGGVATLHWAVTDEKSGTVDVALAKAGAGGWLSLGVPQTAGSMIGGHAIVAEGPVVKFAHMNSYNPPFPEVNSSGLRVKFANATSVVQDGQLILAVSGAKLTLSSVKFIFGLNDACAWPCEHSAHGAETMDISSSEGSAVTGAACRRDHALAAGALSSLFLARL